MRIWDLGLLADVDSRHAQRVLEAEGRPAVVPGVRRAQGAGRQCWEFRQSGKQVS